MTESRMDWFVHDRFGLFIHFGIFSLPGRHEWLQYREKKTNEQYRPYFDHFDADLYDPAEWARAAKSAGMKYAVITTRHHDGFALWDTQVSDFKATNTPAGRDLIREFVDAFRAEELKVGFYFSVIDWHHEDYIVDDIHPLRDEDRDALNAGRDMARYRSFMHAQVRELLSNYGTIDIMWFDWTPPEKSRESWGSEELVGLVKELQPGIILNDRIDYPESADFVTPEEYVATAWPERDGKRVAWETCQTLNGSWGYFRDNRNWKSPDVLIRLLIDSVSKGGNLLLNVGPTGRGEFQPEAIETLRQMGEWTRRHGRSIYGATACDAAPPPDCRLTQRGNRVYLHIFAWPISHILLQGFAGRIEYMQFLHDASEVAFRDADPDAVAQNTTMAESAGDVIIDIPLTKPWVEVPVIEMFLNDA